jgi:hypothetical protein
VASYHFSVQIIKRSRGQSVIAAAAYRAGSRIQDQESGHVHDYSRRRGVVSSEIVLPSGAAPFLSDRAKLWNLVDRMEGRRDAQLAREINLALPHELDADKRRKLLLSFVQEAFISRGMVADVAIHAPVLEKGDHEHNHHAHILLTLRQATAAGLRPVKTREWNSGKLLAGWRALWAEQQNRALELAGLAVRVDHRTLEAQRGAALARGDKMAAVSLLRRPEIHVGAGERRFPAAKQPVGYPKGRPKPRSERNAAVLAKNAEQARRQLDMWRRALTQQLQKPRRRKIEPSSGSKPSMTPGRADPFNLASDTPVGLAELLRRMGDGITAWEIILHARLTRQADFRGRYLANVLVRDLLSGSGRHRLRLRHMNPPMVPQPLPAAFKPVSHLGRQNRISDLPRHQNQGPPVGKPHDLRGIEQIARSLAHALARIVSHQIDIRL